MSRLLSFCRGEGADSEGRFLKDIWTWDDGKLEAVHDFIQWLFPLPEPSQFNPNAPLLTESDIAASRSDQSIHANMRKSFERFLTFLGLAMDQRGRVVEGPNFAARAREIWAHPNHNWLRITRVLRSLRLLGLEAESLALYKRLETFHRAGHFPISADTFRYWTAAANEPPFES